MGLETATYTNNLNANWPLGTDPKAQGDDHLRLVKKVLKSTFPAGYDDASLPVVVGRAQNTRRVGKAFGSWGPTVDMATTKTLIGSTVSFTATSMDVQATLLARCGVSGLVAGQWQSARFYMRMRNMTDGIDGTEVNDTADFINMSTETVSIGGVMKVAVQAFWPAVVGNGYRFDVYGSKATTNGNLPIEQLTCMAHCLT